MSTRERCLQQAQESERLAALVSYERDRARLLRQAAEWRERAGALDASAAVEEEAAVGGAPWWRRALDLLRRPRPTRGG